MADTRTIYLHTGEETFSSDPTDTQYKYLDMSDYDSLNPEYQSTIKLSNGVAGIYEDTKAKITLTFKGANSGRDERAEWVNKYAERINKISVSSTNNKGQVFNKSATVSYVEFIDTPYIDGVQVQIEVTMFGRWQSALSIIETVTEKYEGGTKAYLGQYSPEIPNLITNGNFSNGWAGWSQHDGWTISDYSNSPKGSNSAYTQLQDKSLVLELPQSKGTAVTIKFMARGDIGGQAFHADLWGGEYQINPIADTNWNQYTLSGIVTGTPQLFVRLVGGGTLYVSDFEVSTYGNNLLTNSNFYNGTSDWGSNSSWVLDNEQSVGEGASITTNTVGSGTLLLKNFVANTDDNVVVSFYAKSDTDGQILHSETWGSTYRYNANLTKEWVRYSYTAKVMAQKTVYFWAVSSGRLWITNFQLEKGTEVTPYYPNPADYIKRLPHYSYDYRYGNTTLLNQISLPKDKNRFMLAIDSNYTVATITLSAGGKRATISTSRLNTNSSISSDFVAYDITEFVDTDKFLLLTSGLVASVVWDNLASQYAVLYNIMNSVGDTPADISVTTTGGQHIPFKLYTYSVQDFI